MVSSCNGCTGAENHAGENPGLAVIAGHLAVGSRSLQNRLQAEGTNYRQLLDRVRKEIAMKYLQRQEVAVCDISLLLGFSEQSAFNHAFKRWTGLTPLSFRKSGIETELACRHNR